MYLVTGATGNVGSEVVERLLAKGERVRVYVRDVAKAATQWGDRVEAACGDFDDPNAFARAIGESEAVFLMSSRPDPEVFGRLAGAAKAHGGARIVFLSTCWAGSATRIEIGEWHRRMEDSIRESGLAWTFVRPSAFMTNCYQWAGTLRTEGVVYNAMGSGKSAPVAPEDIGAVAVRALMDAGLVGNVFEVTGGELLSVPDQVNILAQTLGRSIRCLDVPVESAVERIASSGAPARLAAAVGESFAAVRDGRAATATDTVEKVTGSRPVTFERWVQRHAARFA